MKVIKPKKLKPGDTIGIVAPSGFVIKERVDAAAENLRNYGFNVVIHPQCYEREGVTAGNIKQRINALQDVFSDSKIDAVFAASGGVRGIQLLDRINYDLLRKNPKIFFGYSDTTFFHSALSHRSGISTTHGISLMSFHPERNQKDQQDTVDFIKGEAPQDLLHAGGNVRTLCAGEASGKLFGGNFCLLNDLMAMGVTENRFFPSLEGSLLMIEEVGEELRLIDRMLTTLRLSGVLEQISGLIIGHMTDIRDGGDTYKFNCSVEELISEHVANLKIPVITGAPFGHEVPNSPFPIGIRARLTAPANGRPQLQLLESPFAD